MSARQLPITLQGLNSLYSRYLSECIIQYLPRELMNQVSTMINMRSAIDVYKYLDVKLSNLQNTQNCNSNINISSIQRKPRQSKTICGGNTTIESNNNNNNNNSNNNNNNNNNNNTSSSSSIDRRAYLQDDRQKIQSRRMSSLLKRANTLFQKPEERQKAISSVEQKQQRNIQPQSLQSSSTPSGTVKKTHGQSQSTNYIPMQSYRHHQVDTLSDNRLYQSPDYKKDLTTITKATKSNTVNRGKLLAIVRQVREVFAENSKKILRYENLSSDISLIQTSNKMVDRSCGDGVNNGYSNGGSYAYNFISKRY